MPIVLKKKTNKQKIKRKGKKQNGNKFMKINFVFVPFCCLVLALLLLLLLLMLLLPTQIPASISFAQQQQYKINNGAIERVKVKEDGKIKNI